MKKGEKVVFDENFDIFKYLSDYTDSAYNHCMTKYPEREWMFAVQKFAWNPIYQAKDTGQKLVVCGACAPPELVFALDAFPVVFDAVSTRLASNPDVVNHYIDLGTEHLPSTVCGIDRVIYGMMVSGDVKLVPDAYVYGTLPCDSSRIVYPKTAEMLEAQGVPTMCLDVPYRKDEFGVKYLADQLEILIEFLEDALSTKLDWNKMAVTIMRANEATDLLQKNAALRKLKPCPTFSRLLVLNEFYLSLIGSKELVDYFRAQLDFVHDLIVMGIAQMKPENYRVTWLQDMLWSNVGILDWMEREYGAVVVMDVLGYEQSLIIDDPWDRESVLMGLARRQLMTPMLHASSGPAAPYIELAQKIIEEYDINMSMFIGHVGCKHTWACAKIVKDAIEDKFGIPTLTLDLDAIDGRYKSDEEIKATISEYIESMNK